MPTTSPNMGLTVPLVGDAGTGYATNISAALNLIDAHNHTSGKGVLVPTAGLNINADLAFGGFQATGIVAAVFGQLANTTTNLTNQALTNVLGRPYWRDNSGVIKQVTLAGDPISGLSALTLQAIAAPATPAAGFGVVYVDSTSKALAVKNDAGVVSHTARTLAVVASQFVTGLNDAGTLSTAQVNFSDLAGSLVSGTGALGSLLFTAIAAPGTPAAGRASVYVDSTSKNLAVKNDAGAVNHGVQTKAAVASNWLRSIADDGSSLQSQPAFTDISGTLGTGAGGTGQNSAAAGFDALGSTTASIAAATTTDLSTVSGGYVLLTGAGAVNITSFGTVANGRRVTLRNTTASSVGFTHNSTSLLCPGGAQGVLLDIGDSAEIISLGGGNWQVLSVNNVSVWVGKATTTAVGLQTGGTVLMQVSGTTLVFNATILANAGGGSSTPSYSFNADTGTGMWRIGAGDIGFGSATVQQYHINANGLIHNTRHQQKVGATVASATTITLGNDGNVFPISGTTPITGITTTNWQAGSIVVLIPASASITLGHLTTAGGIRTKTGAAVAPVASNAYMLVYDGTTWDLL